MVSRVIQSVSVSLPELAKLAGISLFTLRSYREERRTPSPENLRKLAKALRAHAMELNETADRLDSEAERKP
jgi:transcriptional regulator with XRE-family HTH domain